MQTHTPTRRKVARKNKYRGARLGGKKYCHVLGEGYLRGGEKGVRVAMVVGGSRVASGCAERRADALFVLQWQLFEPWRRCELSEESF